MATTALLGSAAPLCAELQPPNYEECRLNGIFPAGGRQGTSVSVELFGYKGGLAGPNGIIIDGPPGITVSELEAVSNNNVVKAKFTIAADAPLGRRWVRVASERSGLTNFAHFVVGGLAEHLEKEPNNESATAEQVTLPLVVNGRTNPKADIDCFRFTAKKGQRIVAAVAAHAIDVHGQGGNRGMADFTLELLDGQGRVVVESLDEVGFDPLIELEVPADETYTARVKMVAYKGFPEAVYRLTIGEVPYVTGAFPPGVQRGRSTEIEFFGPNIQPGTRRSVTARTDDVFPLTFLTLPGSASGRDIPVLRGDCPESPESEPNNEMAKSNDLAMHATINGRFDSRDDADWYRIRVADKKPVFLQIMAHRFVRSPVDTVMQLYDPSGKLLQENDDDGSIDQGYVSYHDFRTTDSCLLLRPDAPGDFYVRVTDRNGAHGPRAVYRLTTSHHSVKPAFRLRHYPDAVPIWGPGSTAALMVRVDWLSYPGFDIEMTVEGLPKGWQGSKAKALGLTKERPNNPHKDRVYLTITAPSDAPVGTIVPFRIVGRTTHEGETIESVSYPMTWYDTGDTGFFRIAPQSRAAIAKPRGPWLEAMIDELTVKQGDSATIPVLVHGAKDLKAMPLVVNLGTGISSNLGVPMTLPIKEDGFVNVPLVDTARLPVGDLAITVAQTWRSDIRIGMPGPCTPIIHLHVRPR